MVITKLRGKSPVFGRQRISRPMRIEAPIQKEILLIKTKFAEKNLFFARRFFNLYEWNFLNLRPLVFSICPQGFWISKKFGDWTSGSVRMRGLGKNSLGRTDGRTDIDNDMSTYRKNRHKGRFFENLSGGGAFWKGLLPMGQPRLACMFLLNYQRQSYMAKSTFKSLRTGIWTKYFVFPFQGNLIYSLIEYA